MQLFIKVKLLSGKILVLELEPTFTVEQVKELLSEEKHAVGMSASQQRLIFVGKELEDDRTLEDCGITAESAPVYLLAADHD